MLSRISANIRTLVVMRVVHWSKKRPRQLLHRAASLSCPYTQAILTRIQHIVSCMELSVIQPMHQLLVVDAFSFGHGAKHLAVIPNNWPRAKQWAAAFVDDCLQHIDQLTDCR